MHGDRFVVGMARRTLDSKSDDNASRRGVSLISLAQLVPSVQGDKRLAQAGPITHFASFSFRVTGVNGLTR